MRRVGGSRVGRQAGNDAPIGDRPQVRLAGERRGAGLDGAGGDGGTTADRKPPSSRGSLRVGRRTIGPGGWRSRRSRRSGRGSDSGCRGRADRGRSRAPPGPGGEPEGPTLAARGEPKEGTLVGARSPDAGVSCRLDRVRGLSPRAPRFGGSTARPPVPPVDFSAADSRPSMAGKRVFVLCRRLTAQGHDPDDGGVVVAPVMSSASPVAELSG